MKIWKIMDGLYQGSKIDDPEMFKFYQFDAVIDVEGGFDGIPKKNLFYTYYHFYDAPWLPNIQRLKALASLGSSLWKAGDRVLVHCSRGMNRSSLINGLILKMNGFTGREAVKIIIDQRPGALLNPVFRFYLLSLH